jgi:heme exporter protein A
VQHALEQVGLSPVADLPAAQLSQGQRKRLSLARLHLPPVPPLVVLDEPFNALDPASGEQLRDTLQRHLAQGGTLVYTTHQPQRLPAARLRVLDLHGVH